MKTQQSLCERKECSETKVSDWETRFKELNLFMDYKTNGSFIYR